MLLYLFVIIIVVYIVIYIYIVGHITWNKEYILQDTIEIKIKMKYSNINEYNTNTVVIHL